MNPPYGAILFFAVFFGFMAVVGLVQAHRKKERLYYSSAMIGFLVLLGFVSIFLNQFILGVIILGAAVIWSIAGLPKVLKLQERQLQEVDLSAPLRRREFLSNKMWMKLACRWGVWKAVTVYSLLAMTVIAAIVTVILSMWGIMDIWYVVGTMVSSTTALAIKFHHQISKALVR